MEADPASRLQELEALERLAREADQAGRDESGAAAEPPLGRHQELVIPWARLATAPHGARC